MSSTASQLISHLTASDQHTSLSQEYDLTEEDTAELEALQREFDAQQEEEEVTQELSKDLIAKRVLTKSILDEGEQAISTALSTLTHFHLDGLHLSSITCITPYTQLTHLYLQRNSITDITPLASLTHLTFLALMYNHIHDLSPLTPLTELLFLDVSHNDIITFEIESLPDSLRVFNCKENPLEETSDAWKHDVLTHLDLLKKWDDIEVTREYRLQLGVEVSDDETSDAEEERKPPPIDTHATTLHNLDVDEAVESVHDVTHELMERSKQRMKQYQQEHTSSSSSS